MTDRRTSQGGRVFAATFALVLLVRLFVPGSVLDRLYNYDLVGGAPWMKIHPGTYMMLALAGLVLARRGPRLRLPFRRAVLALLTAAFVCALSCILRGSTTALGLLVDNMLCAAAGLFCLAHLDAPGMRLAVCAVLGSMTLNALMIFYEFAARTNVFKPVATYSAYFFRPTGLLNHPLDNGLYLIAAIPAATLLRRPLYVNMGLALIFLVASFAAGARLASILAGPTLIGAGLIAARQATQASPNRQRINLMLAIAAAVALPLALLLALEGGVGYRFGGDLLDVSARTRWNVYALVGHLDAKSLMLGAGVDQMTLYASSLLNELVESPLVIAIFMFGLPLGLLYLGVMAYALYEGARTADLRVKILVIAFLLVGASNNVFVSKTPSLLYALVLVYGAAAFRRSPDLKARAASDADRRRHRYADLQWNRGLPASSAAYGSPGASAFSEKA